MLQTIHKVDLLDHGGEITGDFQAEKGTGSTTSVLNMSMTLSMIAQSDSRR